MKLVKFGVLGVSGHLLKRVVLPLGKTSNCCLHAISSRDKQKAKSAALEFNIPVSFDNYDELLDCPEVDAIYNPLPNHLHASWTIKALEKGKPVLCEKPLAMDRTEARSMAEASIKTGVPLMEGFMYKFHPLWRHARDQVRTNQIGEIKYIHTSFSYYNPDKSNIRNVKAFGGGALMDIGCYAISVPRFILDREPIRVMATMDFHPRFETDVQTSGLLDFETACASFHVSTLSAPFQKVDIIGTSGTINIQVPFNTPVDVPSTLSITNSQGTREVTFPASDQYGLMFEAFSGALLNGIKMPVDMSDAINNMTAIDATRASAASGEWVKISGF